MKARVIAYYLPQYHPIPENDQVWGPGFTEWTNVAQAKPLFRGHYQPHIPADLGFYDLRLPEIKEQQARLAQKCGIEGFCYYHYWMGNGKLLLQRPFQEMLTSGTPDFPYCLCWANHEWTTKTWQKDGTTTLIAPMVYAGDDDYINHFKYVLPAFQDKRYICIEDKPLFCIYDPYHFKDVSHFIQLWRQLAKQHGLPGIYFTAMVSNTTTIKRDINGSIKRVLPHLQSSQMVYEDILKLGFDGINSFGKSRGEMMYLGKYRRIIRKGLQKALPFLPTMQLDYAKVVRNFFAPEDSWNNVYPTILPNWDRTPRAGKAEGVYVHSTPQAFKAHLQHALSVIQNKDDEHRVLFLKSWNEWGEGNYVEPDLKFGHGYLDAIREVML